MEFFNLLFAVPIILSMLSGFAITFVYFPVWLVQRYPLNGVRKAVAWFSFAGLLACLVFVVKYAVTRTEIVSQSIWVWPASTGLAALDPPGTATIPQALVIYGMTILSNVGLYGWMGLGVGLIAGGRKDIAGRALKK